MRRPPRLEATDTIATRWVPKLGGCDWREKPKRIPVQHAPSFFSETRSCSKAHWFFGERNLLGSLVGFKGKPRGSRRILEVASPLRQTLPRNPIQTAWGPQVVGGDKKGPIFVRATEMGPDPEVTEVRNGTHGAKKGLRLPLGQRNHKTTTQKPSSWAEKSVYSPKTNQKRVRNTASGKTRMRMPFKDGRIFPFWARKEQSKTEKVPARCSSEGTISAARTCRNFSSALVWPFFGEVEPWNSPTLN